MFAKIDPEGAVLKYPYTLEQFQRDHPGEDITDLADAIELGVVPVEDAPQPELAEGQTLDEGLPINSNGVWLRNWIVHDWLEIEPGGLYARIDGESITYPYTAADVRRDFGVASRAGAIRQMDGEFGIVPVETVEPPAVTAEQVAEPDGIEQAEGVWQQKWTVRDRTVDELTSAKNAKCAEIEHKAQSVLSSGFTPSTGPLTGHTLQTRDMVDRTNWLTSQAAYSAAVAAGQGDVEGASFRTEANETIVTTFTLGLNTLLAMAAWGKAVMANSWALKDQAIAAESFTELEAIDIEQGWPE